MASRSLGTLTLDLIARIGGFEKGMDQASRIADNRARSIESSARRIGRAVTAAFGAIGGAALVRKVAQATIEQENNLRQLEQRLKSTGSVAGVTSAELVGLAESLQKVTTVEDDAIVGMQTLLLSFTNVRGEVFRRANEIVLDVGAALNKDLESSALLVGKALNDPVKGASALARAGVQLDESQKNLVKRLAETGRVAEAQGILLDELSKRFGGSARAAADTFGGALLQAKNAVGELFEAPGGVDDAKTSLQEFTKILQDPATIAAVGTLTRALIIGFAKAAEAISGVANAYRQTAEAAARFRSGAAADDILGLQDELDTLQNMRDSILPDARIRFFGKDGVVEYYSDAELDAAIAAIKDRIAESRIGPKEIFDLRQRLDLLKEMRKSSDLHDRVRFFGKDGFVEYYDDAELDAEIEKIRAQLERKFVDVTVRPITTPTEPIVAPPTEAFLKLKAQLEEQIELSRQQIRLHGEVGEAAKLSFRFQSEALQQLTDAEDRLTDAEQRRVLALARSLDAINASAKLQDLARELESQVALFEKSGLAALKYRLSLGDLARTVELAGDAGKEFVDSLLAQQTALEQLQVDRQIADINTQIEELRGNTEGAVTLRFDIQNADLAARLEELGDESGKQTLRTLREMTIEQAKFNELREEMADISRDLALAEERIRNSQEVGAITELDALQRIGAEREEALAQLDATLEKMRAIAAESGNEQIGEQMKEAEAEVEKLGTQVDLLAERVEGTLKDSFADAFGDLISGSKSAGEALDDFFDGINRRVAELLAQNVAEALFGGISGGGKGGGGGFFGNLFGGIFGGGSGSKGGSGNSLMPGEWDWFDKIFGIFGFGGGRAAGGDARAGMLYRVNEAREEYFLPRMDGTIVPLGPQSAGGRVAVTQNIMVSGRTDRRTSHQIQIDAARRQRLALSRLG